MAQEETVRVLVKKAIAYGGKVIRPAVSGSKVTPVEAEIPLAQARAYGPGTIQILDEGVAAKVAAEREARTSAAKQAKTPKDKQAVPGKDK